MASTRILSSGRLGRAGACVCVEREREADTYELYSRCLTLVFCQQYIHIIYIYIENRILSPGVLGRAGV